MARRKADPVERLLGEWLALSEDQRAAFEKAKAHAALGAKYANGWLAPASTLEPKRRRRTTKAQASEATQT